MDYSQLQTQFTGLLNRRDCTTTQAQSFIQQAIMRIQRELRVPAMEKSVQLTVGGIGTAVCTAVGVDGSGNYQLTFAALPSGVVIGNDVADLTTDSNVQADITVIAINAPSVSLSSQCSVSVGDNIQFTTSNYTWAGIPIPTDFLELIDLIPVSDPFDQARLEKTDITRALQLSAVPGLPEVYARQGGYWIVGPAPQQGDIIQIDYYGEFTPIVNPTDTNILLTIAWDMVMYCALSYAADWFTDKRAATFEGRYLQMLADLNDMAEDDDDSGAAGVMPAYMWPPDYADGSGINWGVVP